MLDHYFSQRRVLTRMRANVLGPRLDQFAAHLASLRCSPVTVRQYVLGVERFGRWLRRKKHQPNLVEEVWIEQFLCEFVAHCRRRASDRWRLKTVRAALRHFLRMLEQCGDLQRKPAAPQTAIDVAVQEFAVYQREVRGLTEGTCKQHVAYMRRFLRSKYGDGPVQFEALQAKDIMNFVAGLAKDLAPGSADSVASILRGYLRFLQISGACDASLVGAVPRVPKWNLSHLPKTLNEEQLRQFLACFDRSTPNGRRNYAMILCMSELGLRVSEVAALRLGDIHWRAGTIRITSGKTRRSHELPLPQQLGHVIADYLQHDRPTTSSRNVFVRHRCPVGTPVSTDSIRAVVFRACAKLEGWAQSKGTHILRHTLATRLYQKGANLKEVADILGHRSLDSTVIYTKVGIPRLMAVALPWPEEVQP